MGATERINVAMDKMTAMACYDLASKVGGLLHSCKIHSLWDRVGPECVDTLKKSGAARVWVDMKLKDTPDTVADRAAAVRESGADILTVHASGGIAMMQAAVENGPPEIYAVTVLTSLTEEEAHLLHGQPAKAAVLYMARLAKLAGVHGIVCSPHEVGILAKQPELKGMEFTTPGIRLAGQAAGQQARFDTPEFAIKQGATKLVAGSAITKQNDPVAATHAIAKEIEAALAKLTAAA